MSPLRRAKPGSQALAVVIGRAGSKGLPGKNSRLLAGRPMICHAIQHALDSRCVDRVIVSTDGPAIARAAEAMGVEVIARPADLASDTAPIDGAVRHAVLAAESEHELIVILYANVPVRPPGLIDDAVSLLASSQADSVQSYCDVGKHHPWWMVSISADGRIQPHVPNAVYRRQDLPALFIPDGGVIAVTRPSLFTVVKGQPDAFLGSDRRGIVLPAGSVVDVDASADFALAEAMLAGSASHAATEPQRVFQP